MSIKPILFNTDMVRAILDGRKTVTRRVVKPQPTEKMFTGVCTDSTARNDKTVGQWFWGDKPGTLTEGIRPPYQPGDILYVRETWHKYTKRVGKGEGCHLAEFYGYKASVKNSEDSNTPWKPSIHMPKEAARIWLKVTNVRVERLQDITHTQAEREGVGSLFFEDIAFGKECYKIPYIQEEGLSRHQFAYLWDSTIKKPDIDKYGWEANPFVWVIEFERCEKPQEGSH